MKCNQHTCDKDAVFVYTWPGRNQAGACADHAVQLSGVADALGMHLQIIPIEPEEHEAQDRASRLA